MSDDLLRRSLSIRLTEQMAAELRQAAIREANPDSAVARRLIAAGFARTNRHPTPPTDAV